MSVVAPEFSRPGSTEVVFRSTKEQLNLSCEVRQYVYPKASVKWYKRLATGTVNVHVGDTMLNSEIDVGDVTIYICEAKNYPNGVTRRKTFFVRTYGEVLEPHQCIKDNFTQSVLQSQPIALYFQQMLPFRQGKVSM